MAIHFFLGRERQPPQWAMASSFTSFLDHTRRRTTVGRTPLDELISSSQRPLPDNTQQSQQTSMAPVGFEPTISAGERPRTYALKRAATGTGIDINYVMIKIFGNYPSRQISNTTCRLLYHKTIDIFPAQNTSYNSETEQQSHP